MFNIRSRIQKLCPLRLSEQPSRWMLLSRIWIVWRAKGMSLKETQWVQETGKDVLVLLKMTQKCLGPTERVIWVRLRTNAKEARWWLIVQKESLNLMTTSLETWWMSSNKINIKLQLAVESYTLIQTSMSTKRPSSSKNRAATASLLM